MVQLQRTRRKKIGVPAEKSKFDATTLLNIAKDLQAGKLPLERVRVSDDMVVGLRAVVNRSGLVTLHASYEVGENRPFMLLGSLNKDADNHITIEEARELTRTIKALADRGIDVQDGLHKRLIRELKEQGTRWRLK
ncbi:hypothetical protein ACRAVF_19220 [Bradyrhizobium oligotrophicum S58]